MRNAANMLNGGHSRAENGAAPTCVRRRAVVAVVGPTASGKSECALDVALDLNGCIVNADSMQVYRNLRVLTARPSAADMARVPHRLYGMIEGGDACSAWRWADMAATEIAFCRRRGLLPVLVGGSGLYLRVLMEGLSPIPNIPPAVRAKARGLMAQLGPQEFHAALRACDPLGAAAVRDSDMQRQVRAWEVFQATGRSIVSWWSQPKRTLIGADWFVILIAPDRQALYQACDQRFDDMLRCGALEEAQALDALGLSSEAPIMKALGVVELRRHLRGESSLHQAAALAKLATRRFAKRQMTWLRGQVVADHVVTERYASSVKREICTATRHFLQSCAAD